MDVLQTTSVLPSAYIPPADVVQEFRITTANFDAAQGFSTGAAINVSIKSGTNQVHGTAYYFLRNPVLMRTGSSAIVPGCRSPLCGSIAGVLAAPGR